MERMEYNIFLMEICRLQGDYLRYENTGIRSLIEEDIQLLKKALEELDT